MKEAKAGVAHARDGAIIFSDLIGKLETCSASSAPSADARASTGSPT
jgi:hypothetical protein